MPEESLFPPTLQLPHELAWLLLQPWGPQPRAARKPSWSPPCAEPLGSVVCPRAWIYSATQKKIKGKGHLVFWGGICSSLVGPLHEASRGCSQHQCPTGPPLSLQLGGECAGGQNQKPPLCVFLKCLLASLRKGNATLSRFPLHQGECWLSSSSLQSPCAAPMTRDLRQGEVWVLLSHPCGSVPFPWARPCPVPQAALSPAVGVSLCLSWAVQVSSSGTESSDQSPGRGGKNSRITGTALCPLCRP